MRPSMQCGFSCPWHSWLASDTVDEPLPLVVVVLQGFVADGSTGNVAARVWPFSGTLRGVDRK